MAGLESGDFVSGSDWIPAFAGMTASEVFLDPLVFVIPANAGIQSRHQHDETTLCFVSGSNSNPACTGMTDSSAYAVVP